MPGSHVPPSSTLPGRLAGLSPLGLMAEALRPPVASSWPGERWTPPSVEALAPVFPHYRLARLAGRGGMGAVYEGLHTGLNRRVAVKVLPVEMSDDPAFAARFEHEARAMASLRHPAIVVVYDSGQTIDGHLFYAMEYVEGEDLATRLSRGRPELAEVLALIREICGALSAAHGRGVIHRDIKPANILLTNDGHAKLADFGLALSLESAFQAARLTHAGSTMGTLEYAAPEQLGGNSAAGPAADIYSLGVLTYELLTGELPRGVFDPPSARNPDVDPAFDGVVLRALQSDPARRQATVGDFNMAMGKAADRRERESVRQRELRRRLARRAWAASTFGGLALLAAIAAMYGWKARRDAVAQSAEARRQRAEAESMADFLVDNFQKKLLAVGRSDLLEESHAKVERYYAGVSDAPRDAASLAREAHFLQNRHYLLRLKGDLAGSIASSQKSVVRWSEAVARERGRLDWRGQRAVAWQTMGEVEGLRHDFPAAVRYQKEAQRIAADGTPGPPEDPALRHRWAVAGRHRGSALMNAGRFGEAESCQRELMTLALAEIERIAGSPVPAVGWLGESGALHLELGSLAERRDDLEEALRQFKQGEESYHRVALLEKWNFDTQYALVGAGSRVAGMLYRLERPLEALEAIVAPERLCDELERRSPGSTFVKYQRRCMAEIMTGVLDGLGRSAEAAEWKKKRDDLTVELGK